MKLAPRRSSYFTVKTKRKSKPKTPKSKANELEEDYEGEEPEEDELEEEYASEEDEEAEEEARGRNEH